MKLGRLLSSGILLISSLIEANFAVAQSYMDDPGIPAFTTAFPVEHGFINLANGNLHLEIPIASYPQRGNKLQYHARLVYDSRFWTYNPIDDTRPTAWQPDGVPSGPGIGWRLITGEEPGTASNSQSFTQCGCGQVPCALRTTYKDFVYQEPDGTNYRAPKSFTLNSSPSYCGGAVATGSAYSSDNSGYRFVVTNGVTSIFAPDGTLVAGPGLQVQDTNGNFSTYSAGNVTDTLGRIPVITSGSGNQTFVDYLNPQGGRSRIILTTVPLALATQFGTGGEYTGTLPALQSIFLPDNTSYQFQYDTYGQITSMTLPTGGQVTYGYTNTIAPNQINRWLTARTAGGSTWTFSPAFTSCTAPCNPLTVTVTTPPYGDGVTTASDDHVYSFFFASTNGGGGAWPAQIQYFRGAATGSPLLTLTKEYNSGTNNSCQQPMGNLLAPVLIRETLIWPSGSGTLVKKAEYCFDSNGLNLITKRLWDYQPNGAFAAAPDREVDTTYVTDPSYVNANILVLPLTVTSHGAGGVQMAQTTYAYDEGTLQASNITTNHTTPSGPRGNLTSVSRWLNTTGGTISTSTQWFDTGEVYKSIDPLLHTTTFSYDSAFAGAYVTQTCNALSQCSYMGYDLNTGMPTSSTDVNGTAAGDPGHTTTYTYDSMLRPLCTNTPDGRQTCLGYPSATTASKTFKITPTLNDSSSVIVDSLGRLSQTQHVTPAGTAKVDTTYDPLGQVSTVSNPYFTASDPTYGITSYLYDGLGRVTKTARQDGSISTTSYSANCVTATDEAGKARESCHDGFGRLINVWEDPNGLNYETDYQYDALSNLVRVD
jgi:YD repeat-containing protein